MLLCGFIPVSMVPLVYTERGWLQLIMLGSRVQWQEPSPHSRPTVDRIPRQVQGKHTRQNYRSEGPAENTTNLQCDVISVEDLL